MIQDEAVTIFLNKVKKAYIDDQRAKGMVASGKSAESLKTETNPTGGTLSGSSYFYFLTSKPKIPIGRKPGKFPPIEAIIQWLKDKKTFKVEGDKGISLKSLAFLIARKIAGKSPNIKPGGTDIFMRKRPALNVEDKIAEYRQELIQSIGSITKQKIVEALKKIPQTK